jgi:hypothetical protein
MGYVLETYKVMYDEKTIGYYHVCNDHTFGLARDASHACSGDAHGNFNKEMRKDGRNGKPDGNEKI